MDDTIQFVDIRRRKMAVVSQFIVLGVKIPFLRQITTFAKECDDYEWMDNMRELRALIDAPHRGWKPAYWGVVDLVTLPSEARSDH